MTRVPIIAAALFAIIGVAMVSIAGWGNALASVGYPGASRLPGSIASTDTPKNEPALAQFGESEALGLMAAAADRRVAETIGRPQSTEAGDVLPAQIDGRPLSLADLALNEVKFFAAATRVETSIGTFAEFVEPTDAWVAVWTRQEVDAPDWGIPATVRVSVEMKDGSGDIRSIHVQRVNPAAPTASPR